MAKANKDPKRELPVLTDEITEVLQHSLFYEEMYISKNTFINFMAINSAGIFTFSCANEKEQLPKMTKEILRYFSVPVKALFAFFFIGDNTYVCDGNGNIEECDDFYYPLNNLYTNLLRPEIDRVYLKMNTLKDLLEEAEIPEEYTSDNSDNGKTYEHEGVVFEVHETYDRADDGDAEYVVSNLPLSEQERISDIADKITFNEFPDATYKVDKDGQEWILKESSVKIKNFDTGLIGAKKWFRISDRDEMKMLYLTALGGNFGLHKLAVGNIISFIAYFITCGGFGIFTALDVIQFFTGSAGYDEVNYLEDENGVLTRDKERVYYRKIKNRWIVAACLVISVLLSFIIINFVYEPVVYAIIKAVSGTAANMDEESVIRSTNFLKNIFNY